MQAGRQAEGHLPSITTGTLTCSQVIRSTGKTSKAKERNIKRNENRNQRKPGEEKADMRGRENIFSILTTDLNQPNITTKLRKTRMLPDPIQGYQV